MRLSLPTLCALLFAYVSIPTFAEGIVVKGNKKIAFLGDSITADVMGSPIGYCRLVISGLQTANKGTDYLTPLRAASFN